MRRATPRPIQHESIITKAAAEIRRYIEVGKLKPDEPLPPETRLAAMLGISRNSVREALRILDGLGFVQKVPGKRVLAKSPSVLRPLSPRAKVDEAQVISALEVAHNVRFLVEEKCARLAAARRTEADLADLESRLASFAEAMKRDDYSAASHAHVDFHRAVVQAADNPLLTALFDGARRIESDILRRGRGTLKDRRQLRLHAAILDAIRARDVDKAGAAVRRHFHTVAPLVAFLSKD